MRYLPVDGVDGVPGAEKAAITAVTFVGKWIAVRGAAHHVVKVKDIALGPAAAAAKSDSVPTSRRRRRMDRGH